MKNFRFSGLPKKDIDNWESEFLQEKSKTTIIEGDYVNLSDVPEYDKEKD